MTKTVAEKRQKLLSLFCVNEPPLGLCCSSVMEPTIHDYIHANIKSMFSYADILTIRDSV